ncbi:MAG: type II toxin-antitoxin system RelE/ParE family toxin [Burkholderiaceae bacterium]|nr:type II toxin-antitoxin system RelE/ParE family toxin [Burkholderiaceae bacterium]
MARIELAPEVRDDFDRIFDHLAHHDLAGAPARIQLIVDAIDVLATSPLIGRVVANGNRELIIGRRVYGFVALYRYLPDVDLVVVLAIRAQREAGYGREA